MKEYKYTVTQEDLQVIFDYLGVKVDMKGDARSLIIETDAGHGHFMTEFMRSK